MNRKSLILVKTHQYSKLTAIQRNSYRSLAIGANNGQCQLIKIENMFFVSVSHLLIFYCLIAAKDFSKLTRPGNRHSRFGLVSFSGLQPALTGSLIHPDVF